MSEPNGFVLPFIILLVSTSLFARESVVYGSPVREQSFKRPDPLRNFKTYHGGYDIGNKHYWASAAFTGIPCYAIAGVWMLFGLGFGSYLILKNFNNSSSTIFDYPDSSYLIMFSLIALFTFLAIVATSFIIAANQSSLHRTRKLKETLFGAGGDARQTIQRVTIALREMQTFLRPYDPKTCSLLNSTTHRLGEESRGIQRFVDKSRHSSDQAIETLYTANLVVVIVNLVCLIAALVLFFLNWHPGFIIIIFFCWILGSLTWIMTGFDFFFHTFAEDTCSAFEDFEQNPQNNSLKSMLSCAKSSYSDKILVEIGHTIHKFIKELNSKITLLHELLELDEQNEDLLGVWEICDPFSTAPNYSYTPEKCPKDAIPIGDLPNVLSRFTCYKLNTTGNCKGDGRFLPESSYVMAWAYSQSIQDLINIFPDLQSLSRCSSVKQAFSDVVSRQCRPLRASVLMLWSSMLSLSIVMVVLTLLWVAKAYQDRGRFFSICSIIPNPNPA